VPSWQNKPKYENNLIYYTKEFKQIFRNKLPIIFILPLLQLVVLSNAASFEVKTSNYPISVDRSATSRELINKFEASSYFNVSSEFQSKRSQFTNAKGNIDVILEILFTLNAI
jgi:ABC-2 type transport system permease protein